MSEPIRLSSKEISELVVELSCWKPVPYPLVYVAKHELECGVGMAFYVDKWPPCHIAIVIPTSACDFPFLQKAVFLDVKDYRCKIDFIYSVTCQSGLCIIEISLIRLIFGS